jgi:cysteine desulfuration protein SufE
MTGCAVACLWSGTESVSNTQLDLQRIIETFEFLPDWEHRYQFLDELGEKLDPMAEDDMTPINRVPPCMSTVYVKATPLEEDSSRIRYEGYCDTPTIKGVVAILVALFSGRTPQEVVQLDTDAAFSELQLFEHLSPTRHVGVYAIVEKMKAQAREFL